MTQELVNVISLVYHDDLLILLLFWDYGSRAIYCKNVF